MSYDFNEFRQFAQDIGNEHRKAIEDCKLAGEERAKAERAYRSIMTRSLPSIKAQHGATLAVEIAKGEDDIAALREDLEVAEVKDRASFQRVKLAEADRQVLLTMGSWSKAQEAWG